MEHNGSLKHLQ